MTIEIPLWVLLGIVGMATLIIASLGLFSLYLFLRYIFTDK